MDSFDLATNVDALLTLTQKLSHRFTTHVIRHRNAPGEIKDIGQSISSMKTVLSHFLQLFVTRKEIPGDRRCTDNNELLHVVLADCTSTFSRLEVWILTFGFEDGFVAGACTRRGLDTTIGRMLMMRLQTLSSALFGVHVIMWLEPQVDVDETRETILLRLAGDVDKLRYTGGKKVNGEGPTLQHTVSLNMDGQHDAGLSAGTEYTPQLYGGFRAMAMGRQSVSAQSEMQSSSIANLFADITVVAAQFSHVLPRSSSHDAVADDMERITSTLDLRLISRVMLDLSRGMFSSPVADGELQEADSVFMGEAIAWVLPYCASALYSLQLQMTNLKPDVDFETPGVIEPGIDCETMRLLLRTAADACIELCHTIIAYRFEAVGKERIAKAIPLRLHLAMEDHTMFLAGLAPGDATSKQHGKDPFSEHMNAQKSAHHEQTELILCHRQLDLSSTESDAAWEAARESFLRRIWPVSGESIRFSGSTLEENLFSQ